MAASPPSTIHAALVDAVGAAAVVAGADAADDLRRDEALGVEPVVPAWVVRPETEAQVAAVLAACDAHRVPVTARGSGTGLSGAAVPDPDGVLVSFERMAQILEIDADDLVAVVQPGVTLAQLDDALAPKKLIYPVFPGEYSASLGGNVATNAGGMRAVKYGVTRHQVLGLRAALPSGDVISTGGRYVKGSTGYDLTQLVIGSEGTLAVVTEATLRLYPRPAHQATLLAPFSTLAEVTAAVSKVVASGAHPVILEYIDAMTMAAMTRDGALTLGVPDDLSSTASAYLVVQLEDDDSGRLDHDATACGELLSAMGGLDVYVLPPGAAVALIEARERAFWLAKASGADDIIDVVVPRSALDHFMQGTAELAAAHGALVAGCGHAGDGNVHMSVFQPDPEPRRQLLRELFALGMSVGGAISGEHGIGRAKRPYFLELEDPAKVALMRRIKAAFDPHGILNPGAIFD